MDSLVPNESGLILPVNAVLYDTTGIVVVKIDKISYGYIDRPVQYQGITFQPKQELHITIVSEDAEHLLHYMKTHPDDHEPIEDLVEFTDWSYRKLEEYYHVVEKPGVEAIIQMVELPKLDVFFAELSRVTGHGFLLPPTHVTLYTLGTELGISLPSQSVFMERVKAPVRSEEIEPVEDSPGMGAESTA